MPKVIGEKQGSEGQENPWLNSGVGNAKLSGQTRAEKPPRQGGEPLVSPCLEGGWAEVLAQPVISEGLRSQAWWWWWWCKAGSTLPVPHPGCLLSWGCPSPPTGPRRGFAPLEMAGSGLSKADPWQHKGRSISNCHFFIYFWVFPGFSVVRCLPKMTSQSKPPE